MVIVGANQKVIWILPTQDDLDLQNIYHYSCIGILWEVVWGNAPVLQKTGATKEMQGLLKLRLQHGLPFNTLKKFFKCFHNAPKGLKLL